MLIDDIDLTEEMIEFFGDNDWRPIDIAVICSTGGFVRFMQAGLCKRLEHAKAVWRDHHPCLDVLYTPDMRVGLHTTSNGIKLLTFFDSTGEVVKVPSLDDCQTLLYMLEGLRND